MQRMTAPRGMAPMGPGPQVTPQCSVLLGHMVDHVAGHTAGAFRGVCMHACIMLSLHAERPSPASLFFVLIAGLCRWGEAPP